MVRFDETLSKLSVEAVEFGNARSKMIDARGLISALSNR
jgi:hypothetical protein